MQDNRSTCFRWALGLVLLVLGAAPFDAAAQAPPPLQSRAEEIIGGNQDDWGVMAWSVDTGEPLVAINAEEIFIPASNNKIFTSVWALSVLGPDYRFKTDLLVDGPLEDGVLRGNVYLRGAGDPAFGYPDFTEDSMDPLRIMAQQLKARGVRAIEGTVIGDPTVFDSVLVGPAWPGDAGGGSAVYAPRVSGLAFQRNVLWIEAEATTRGQPARIVLEPDVEEIPIESTVTTGGGRAWAVRAADEDTIRIRGAVSRGEHNRFGVGVARPALLAAGALREALEAEGIRVGAPARVGDTPEEADLVHRHVSIPIGAMIAMLNQESDNFFAEHLWKAAVAEAVGVGSYAQGGPASAIFFHENAEVPFGQLYQVDGSGLSRYNQASPAAIIRALLYAHEAPWSELFHESLAVAGDPEGTMRRLFRGTAAEGNLHAKTGYIDDVRTLSGFVRARNGELIAFSFLYNGRNTFGARDVQTELGTLLADYAGSRAVAQPAGD